MSAIAAGVDHLLQRGDADAGVAILARDRDQRVLLIERQFLDGGVRESAGLEFFHRGWARNLSRRPMTAFVSRRIIREMVWGGSRVEAAGKRV